MRTSRIAVVVLLALSLTGCDSVHQILNAKDTIQQQGEQIHALQANVASLKGKLDAIEKEQTQLQVANIFAHAQESAYLTPGDGGYSLVRSDLGILTVQVSNVRPYANGSQVSLRFGNLLASSINGLKLTLQWGEVSDKGVPNYETSKKKAFTFSQSLRSGAWTTVPVVLEGVPPEKLGFVRVYDVTHTGISLAR